jgi:hypothetical protein
MAAKYLIFSKDFEVSRITKYPFNPMFLSQHPASSYKLHTRTLIEVRPFCIKTSLVPSLFRSNFKPNFNSFIQPSQRSTQPQLTFLSRFNSTRIFYSQQKTQQKRQTDMIINYTFTVYKHRTKLSDACIINEKFIR